mgnify:CR=1 FL=1
MSNNFHVNPKEERLSQLREEALNQMKKELFLMEKDIFQVDYLPEKKEIRINLPEEVWENIDTVTLTRLFQEELVVEKQKESEVEEG